MSLNIDNGARYIITNKKGETVIDLSGTDQYSVSGWNRHGGENQQWETIRVDGGWQLKNVWNRKYLSVAQSAQDGVSVVGSDSPFTWELVVDSKDNAGIRIQVPHSYQTVDLSDHGNRKVGTPVTTWGRWDGTNQVWYFDRV